MADSNEAVSGSTGRTEPVLTVRTGKLMWYELTEHQFETLGNLRKLSRKSEICTFCAGAFVSSIIAIPTLSEYNTFKAIALYCIACVSLALAIAFYFESRKDKDEAKSIYETLKKEGAR